ncbi:MULTISPECIES: phytanoyl-CoA dioxygenase family protein [unclassified Sphingomonas]|jgi:chlorinating enzyme|uniref:phytanoyl-CoA dioxygenase family protein n=2 Tax=Sphingomonas TaxID=13687 RepID=UPI00082BD77F|nr:MULTISPECIES: phytanoyl-CoA dioxygenase family protein [unclassified Sphingomonas]
MAMLDREEILAFQRDGYAGPFDLPESFVRPYCTPVFAKSVVDHLVAEIEAGANPFSDRLRNQHLFSESLCALASEEGLLSRLSSILGPDILLWVGHVAPRWPDDEGHRWHIDADNKFIRGVHVSIALADNREENGCLRLIPGSHHHRASLTAAERIGLIDRMNTESVVAYADRVAPHNAPHQVRPMTMRRGQYFLMAEGMWHFVGRNETPEWRTNVIVRYARPDIACRNYGYDESEMIAGEPLACVLVRGEDRFNLNKIVPSPTTDLFQLDRDGPMPPDAQIPLSHRA